MNKELLDKAIKALGIREVCLHASKIDVSDDFDPLFPTLESLSVQFRHGPKSSDIRELDSDDGKHFRILKVRYECGFRVTPPDLAAEVLKDEKEMSRLVLAEVLAAFNVYYAIEQDVEPAAIEEFVRRNVGYHVWPYWREYASSTGTRLRLPSFTVPMYTLQN